MYTLPILLLANLLFSLDFEDFIGTWNGNITNDKTWTYDDSISIIIESNHNYCIM